MLEPYEIDTGTACCTEHAVGWFVSRKWGKLAQFTLS